MQKDIATHFKFRIKLYYLTLLKREVNWLLWLLKFTPIAPFETTKQAILTKQDQNTYKFSYTSAHMDNSHLPYW